MAALSRAVLSCQFMFTWGFLWEALVESILDLSWQLVPDAGYHPALAGTPPEEGNWNYLGRLFLTPLYHGSVFGELSRVARKL